MNRRRALKDMGKSLGYMVAAPALLGMVQNCGNRTQTVWTPEFFTEGEGAVIAKLVDLILPRTDTPSASEVQVHVCIDRFAADVLNRGQQDFVRMSMGKFLKKALGDSGNENGEDLTTEDLEPLLATALNNSKEDETKMFEAVHAYEERIAEGETALLDDVTSGFAFAQNLREMTIWGYKTSEHVGEKVLAYLPVPGGYIECGELEKLTQGRAWSL